MNRCISLAAARSFIGICAATEGGPAGPGKQNSVVVELEYPAPFNPLFIDINDFQFLMPPIMVIPPYTAQSARQIAADLQRDEISRSEFPGGVIQAHLPCIRQENVCNLYRLFELE